MSIVLLLAALYGVMRAAMLCFAPANRAANRLLAGLLLALSLYTFPYIVGYAGYYDAYPWLSYFPYNLALAIGPLLFLYVVCVHAGGGASPRLWQLHLLPAAAQLVYYSAVFIQPLAFKNDWDAQVHAPYVDPAETVLILASLAAYLAMAWRAHHASARQAYTDWIRNLLLTFALTLAAWVALASADLLTTGLSYFQRFPFYLWLGVVIAYVGSEGYRQGQAHWPPPQRQSDPAPVPPPQAPPAPAAPTQAQLGERWRAMVIEGQWWRDPELNLASLAQKIGTNTTALSRAMNEGLGLNFNEMINRLRVDAVVAALQQADDNQAILDIAMAEGFNSKASFNRAFKLYTGKTPSDYRRPRSAQMQVSDSA